MLFRYRFVAAFWRLCSGILLGDCFVVRLRGGCLRSAPVRSGAAQFALWASADDRLRHGDAIINAISSRSREGQSIYRVIGTRRDVTIICQTTWRLILLHLLDATHYLSNNCDKYNSSEILPGCMFFHRTWRLLFIAIH